MDFQPLDLRMSAFGLIVQYFAGESHQVHPCSSLLSSVCLEELRAGDFLAMYFLATLKNGLRSGCLNVAFSNLCLDRRLLVYVKI